MIQQIGIWNLKLLHLLTLLFLILGWIFNGPTLLFHMFFIIITVLHWQLNKGKCILTQWESELKGGQENKVQGNFTRELFKKWVGRAPTDRFLFLFIYSILGVSFLISAVKYWMF